MDRYGQWTTRLMAENKRWKAVLLAAVHPKENRQ
jgi:hypothetical protein